jgi:hypothetical protein
LKGELFVDQKLCMYQGTSLISLKTLLGGSKEL